MTLIKLTSFDQLKIGDKVSTVTLTGVKHYVFMYRMPEAPNYAFFMTACKTDAERKYESSFCVDNNRQQTYIGYDGKFLYSRWQQMLRDRANELDEFIEKLT